MAYVGVWALPTPPHVPIHLLQGWLFQHAPRSFVSLPSSMERSRRPAVPGGAKPWRRTFPGDKSLLHRARNRKQAR